MHYSTSSSTSYSCSENRVALFCQAPPASSIRYRQQLLPLSDAVAHALETRLYGNFVPIGLQNNERVDNRNIIDSIK